MTINFDVMPYIYWSEAEKISLLQRMVIIHSILYYEMNKSILSDKDYDELSKQLVAMQAQASKKDLAKTQYYYVMSDFDGTTGFDLYSRLRKGDKMRLSDIASFVYKSYAKGADD